MKELEQILHLWAASEAAGDEALLATVVKTQGSSYRLPGARLLLTRHGQRVGSISGGCLEDDVVKKAWWLTEKGPIVRRYDTTPDNEISTSGYGLGCNGIIHVLMERVKPGKADILKLIMDTGQTRKPSGVAHILQPKEEIGTRLSIDSSGKVAHNIQDMAFATDLEDETRRTLANGVRRLVNLAQREVFIETLTPRVHLLIFGAGDDAVPLSDMAKYLGWQVTVLDGCWHYARRERFQNADEVIVRNVNSPLPPIDAWTVAVLMSHSYSQDLAALRQLANLAVRYLGILGPESAPASFLPTQVWIRQKSRLPFTDRWDWTLARMDLNRWH